MTENIEGIKQKILPILQNYEVKKVALFGSCVRGEMKEESDVDILIDIRADISLLGFVGLKQKIEDALGRKVDLVEYDTLKPLLRERILKEQVVLLNI
ncbi:MAG: nucleotidyltransferase family protein [Candidatus Omnitrophica bacterium]|nr:nucleotidyltransferase family protein [Candidatus Omnitrophota bacterium]